MMCLFFAVFTLPSQARLLGDAALSFADKVSAAFLYHDYSFPSPWQPLLRDVDTVIFYCVNLACGQPIFGSSVPECVTQCL